MNMDMPETLHVLRVHQLMDQQLPHMKCLDAFFEQWSFDDHGAHYIADTWERKLGNLGAIMWWRIQERKKMGLPLGDEATEDFSEEHARKINYMPESFILC